MAAADKKITVARPTITVNGQDNASLALGLAGLLIAEDTSGLYRCEAIFGNWGEQGSSADYLSFDRRTLEFGKSFAVKLAGTTIFNGRIMALEAHFEEGQPPQIAVLAEDRFQDLRMTRRTRTFDNVSDAAMLRQIAGDHGLTPDVDLTGPTHKTLAQVNQSDLAFLRERARALDVDLWMDDRTLYAKQRSRRLGNTLQLTYGNQLRQFSVIADLAGQHSSVTVSGWDVSAKNGLKYEATDSVINGELNGDLSGASILTAALGQRKEALVHTAPATSQEVRAEAEAYFRLQARRFVCGHGTAVTDERMRVGTYVNLQGLGPLFSGKYYVCEARIRFDGSSGLRTEFTAERPGLGRN